jgi:hypothetical protein
MRPTISILMDSNEKESARATALAKACGGDPAYELAGFGELPVDMRIGMLGFSDITESHVNVELKEISDFWASKGSGHLGQQILGAVADGHPAFVAVFGSLQEVLAGVPKMKMGENMSGCKKPQRRSQMDIASDVSTARAFCADAAACNVPVHFLSSNHEQSFRYILSYAKHILTGPSMASWLPRWPVEPVGYGVLCSIPGIGDVAAQGLLQAYGSVGQIAHEAKYNFDGLTSCRVNGKALGKAKASKLAEVLG